MPAGQGAALRVHAATATARSAKGASRASEPRIAATIGQLGGAQRGPSPTRSPPRACGPDRPPAKAWSGSQRWRLPKAATGRVDPQRACLTRRCRRQAGPSAREHSVNPGEEPVRGGTGETGGRLLRCRRRWVAAGPRREVFVDGLVAELGQEVEPAALGDQPGDGAFGVAQIAEVARAGGAGTHAGRDAVWLRQAVVVDAVDAQGALLHDAVAVIILARAVGAGPRA